VEWEPDVKRGVEYGEGTARGSMNPDLLLFDGTSLSETKKQKKIKIYILKVS